MAIDWLSLYLEEDLDAGGDVTSKSLFPDDVAGHARMVARAGGIVAGTRHAGAVFERRGAEATDLLDDGDAVAAGQAVMEVTGPVRGILEAERTALNLVGRMSGIATRTRRLQDALLAAGSDALVAATRKTTPGFRAFEKEAVRIGGGDPHRMGLFDAMMLKDNHIAAAADVAAAVRTLRAAHPDLLLEVEVESLDAGLAAVAAGAQWILIDNQSPDVGRAWAEALRAEHPAIRIEASGGIQEADLVAYGWADRISLGWLTHAPSLDVGLDWGANP